MKNNNTTSMSTNATSGVQTHSGCDNNPFLQDIPKELFMLGRSGMDFVIFSYHLRQIATVTYKQLEDDNFLKTLLGIQFLLSNYSTKDDSTGAIEINFTELRMHIELLGDIHKHQFDPSKTRGIGIYKSKAGYIINFGAKGVFNSKGRQLHSCHDGYFYMPSGDLGLENVGVATKDDLKNFLKVFASFNFENEGSKRLLGGVVLSSMISRALDFKPVVALVAPPSSGKSTLLGAITTAIGNSSVQYTDSKQNPAKLRALLTEGPTAILLDEFEAKTYRGQALAEMTGIFRASFSNTNDKCINNAIGCKLNRVRLDAQVFMAAVELPQLEQSDLSRMVKIQLLPYRSNSKAAFSSNQTILDTVEEVAPKIRKLFVENIEKLEFYVQAARKKLNQEGLIERVADKWSGIIACSMLAEYVTSGSQRSATKVLKELVDLVLNYESDDGKDRQAKVLRYATIFLGGRVPAGPNGELISIERCIQIFKSCKSKKELAALNARLKPIGLAITHHKESGKMSLAVSGNEILATYLGEIFTDSLGNKTPLEVCFADLALEKQHVVSFGEHGSQRAFILPIDNLMNLTRQDMAA